MSEETLDTNAKEITYLRNMTKPVGDACRDDGTLKDANEMVWPNLPTVPAPPQDDFHNASFPDESDWNDLPSIRVSCFLQI